jgi:hypothetical protein
MLDTACAVGVMALRKIGLYFGLYVRLSFSLSAGRATQNTSRCAS